MKSTSSLRALLNEIVEGRVRTDVEKLAQIREMLIKGNINQKYLIQKGRWYNIHPTERIESLELQLPETNRTSRMVPPSLSAATVTRDLLLQC